MRGFSVRKLTTQVPAHWSKDFVEHLRTVHFALIAISVGLILLLISSPTYNPITALVQIEEILDFKQQWSLDWIKRNVPFDIADSSESGTHFIPTVTVPYPAKTLTIILDHEPGQKYFAPLKVRLPVVLNLHFPSENWVVLPSATSETDWAPNLFPRTLNDFADWWDLFEKPQVIEMPESFGYDAPDFHLMDLGDNPVTNKRTPQVDLNLELSAGFGGPLSYMCREGRIATDLFLDVVGYSAYSVSQQSIASRFLGVRPGPFASSFIDLSIAGHEYANLPMEDIKGFLHDEAAKGPEVFEIFGMKLPAARVTLWGVLLVLSVQLYFFAYVRQLSEKLRANDPGWDVPWIGTDTSRLGKTLLFCSLLVLPSSAVAALGFRALHGATSSDDYSFQRTTRSPWSEQRWYNKREVVEFNGSFYISLMDRNFGWQPDSSPGIWQSFHPPSTISLHRPKELAFAASLVASVLLGIVSLHYRPKVEAEDPPSPPPFFY
jgi:hypothetical protein